MARGWESKGVEQQQEEAATAPGSVRPRQRLSAPQIRQLQRRQTLSLARIQALRQLAAASDPKHRKMLEAAIADLDAQLLDSAEPGEDAKV